MVKQSLLYLLIFIGTISCVQTPSNTRKKNKDLITSNDPNSIPAPPSFGNGVTSAIAFFSSGQSAASITLNADTQNIIFLRGQSVHDFLKIETNMKNKKYCLVVNYNFPGAAKQLRFLATATKFNDPATGIEERLYRIDLAQKATNKLLCDDSIGTAVNTGFSPAEICPTCSGIIPSLVAGIKLHIVQGSGGILNAVAGQIPLAELDTTALSLRVDLTSSTTNIANSCSNTSCINLGFSCCLDGQCVTDGVKRSATTAAFACLQGALKTPQDLSQCSPHLTQVQSTYGQAFADTQENFYNFINYPNYFFVCTNITRPAETPTPTPDAQVIANENLQQDIRDLNCLLGAAATPQDLSTCTPSADSAGHQAVQEKTWQRCGCVATAGALPPNDPASVCPTFGLKPSHDNAGNIVSVECLIPTPTSVVPVPVQFLNLNLSGRRAPHRFFKTDGVAVDDLEASINVVNFTPFTQEGTAFSYQNNNAKIGAVSGKFNMNAILGSFSLNLNQALPAKMIPVNPGLSYYIYATKGSYTPCPTCSKDAWFSSFSAHPTTQEGRGLASLGFITNRENFSNNLTLGNYGDTLFGRACWVPPTMLPFTHKKYATAGEQRLNRLKTQAALFINGQQRDWYGFNKGALIGSFDGVTWFAIGAGRKITAKTNKLFLAINAPYADLADATSTVVQVVEDLGRVENEAPSFDFIPGLDIASANQNSAATCQQHHQCSSDADCITRLGWEYRCADITTYSSKLPNFDINANELANNEIDLATFSSIINPFLAGDLRRCVYRGAGAICHQEPELLAAGKAKLFTCAPNFYCASITSNDFNEEVYRETSSVSNILFGQAANVLGRPKNYINASASLPDEVIANIQENAGLHTNDVNKIGLCRPGKRLSTDDLRIQQKQKDFQGRADYISQLSSCDSKSLGDLRVQTCPVLGFDEDNESEFENYLDLNPATLTNATGFFKAAHIQNACGQESKTEFTLNNPESSFKNIEAQRISSLFDLITPKIAQDACLRRAGSVCHTDLECLPNRLHAAEASFLGQISFGDSEAELNFWEERLVCGQKQAAPGLGTSAFKNYDMTLNRCCREVGSELTMFTQVGTASQLDPDIGSNNSKLQAGLFPYNAPNAEGRYSRFVSAQPSTFTMSSITRNAPISQTPIVAPDKIPSGFQWKTLNDTARRSCCGKGWVRKFSDGGHNWSNLNRLKFNTEAFSCLNYSNEISLKKYDNMSAANYSHDYGSLCLTPNTKGCIQQEMLQASSPTEIISPQDLTASIASLDTSPTQDPVNDGGNGTCGSKQATDAFALYQPIPYLPASNVFNPATPRTNCFHVNNRRTLAADKDSHGLAFYLPLYASAQDNILLVQVKKYAGDSLLTTENLTKITTCNANMDPVEMDNDLDKDASATEEANVYCIFTDSSGFDVLYAKVQHSLAPTNWEYAGVKIFFRVAGTYGYKFGSTTIGTADKGMRGGNDMYYLAKLAKFELLGIPQIFYEPLYCNSNREKLVEDIFNLPQQTRSSFDGNSFTHNASVNGIISPEQMYAANFSSAGDLGNPDRKIVFQDKVALNKVFSGNKFLCCLQLGDPTTNKAQCCSNHLKLTQENGAQGGECALPPGADLHLYFNKFVSGDGMGQHQPGGGLINEDFIPETGEPKYRAETLAKVAELGKRYCDSGSTRKGVAFGNFTPEPNAGFFQQASGGKERYYSIIDSTDDFDPDTDSGTLRFKEGFRWNHHLYCAP